MGMKRRQLSFQVQLRLVLALCALLAIIEIINMIMGRSLNSYGLIPRDGNSGLAGIFLAPFLHGDFAHFLSNIVPFAIFSLLVLQHGFIRYVLVSYVCISLSGLLVWLFGRDAIHVGASGVIYGYFGFLLLAGIFSQQVKLIAISVAVAFVYGGLIFGILPSKPFVSWESHLFGFLTGLLCAYFWGHEEKVETS